jgi:hypothetical protein
VLASLLPGFRHVRNPLVAGALWMLLAWLLFGDALMPHAGGGAIESRLHELETLVGDSIVLAALGLLAILLGGIVPPFPLHAIARRLEINQGARQDIVLCWLFGLTGEFVERDGDFNLWLHRLTDRAPYDLDWEVFKDSDCPPMMRSWAQHASEQPESVRMGRRVVSRPEPMGNDEAWSWLTDLTEASIEEEMATGLPMQLQIEREGLYNDFDRVRAEAELRASIVVPLLWLVILLAVGHSLWWLLGVVGPLLLLRQGVQSYVESEQRLQAAVRYGVVTSPTVEFVRSLHEPERWVDGARHN